MLDPEYLLRIAEGAEDIAEQLHGEILKRVIKRVMRRIGRGKAKLLPATDKWQLESLQEAGFLVEELQEAIAEATKKEKTEIREAFEDAGIRTIKYDAQVYQSVGISTQPLEQSPALIRLLERGYEATMGEWRNLTRTYAGAGQQAYIRAVDKAYVLSQAESVSYSEAVREAIQEVVANGGGIKVEYPSGRSDTIETAVLRAVRSGIAQTCADVTSARMDELKWDIVLVSAHLGARTGDGMDNHTNHYWWQGQFYSRSGNDERFKPFRVCGLGDVQGISGANCRHHFGPGDGINNPYEKFDSEENQRAYEITQRARELERRIRATKREVMGLRAALDAPDADPEALADTQKAYERKAALLQRQNKDYTDFCKENDIRRREERVSIAQWDRHQAAMARAAAKRRKNQEVERKRKIAYNEQKARNEIGTQNLPLTIFEGRQNKHIKSAREYENGKSYLTIGIDEAQEIVNKYANTGELKMSKAGNWNNKEVIFADRPVGYAVDASGNNKQLTYKATIHYSKKGTHIVPAFDTKSEKEK